jgi:hypothetical protein
MDSLVTLHTFRRSGRDHGNCIMKTSKIRSIQDFSVSFLLEEHLVLKIASFQLILW